MTGGEDPLVRADPWSTGAAKLKKLGADKKVEVPLDLCVCAFCVDI